LETKSSILNRLRNNKSELCGKKLTFLFGIQVKAEGTIILAARKATFYEAQTGAESAARSAAFRLEKRQKKFASGSFEKLYINEHTSR